MSFRIEKIGRNLLKVQRDGSVLGKTENFFVRISNIDGFCDLIEEKGAIGNRWRFSLLIGGGYFCHISSSEKKQMEKELQNLVNLIKDI